MGGCDKLLKEVESGAFYERLTRNNIALPPGATSTPATTSTTTTTTSAAVVTAAVTTSTPSVPLSVSSVSDSDCDSSSSSSGGFLNNNYGPNPSTTAIDPLQLSSLLQRQALLLTDKYSSLDGSRVDYKKMKASIEFQTYMYLSASLQQCSLADLSTLSTQKRTSFFVNLYNAMIIHANCVLVSISVCVSVSDKMSIAYYYILLYQYVFSNMHPTPYFPLYDCSHSTCPFYSSHFHSPSDFHFCLSLSRPPSHSLSSFFFLFPVTSSVFISYYITSGSPGNSS